MSKITEASEARLHKHFKEVMIKDFFLAHEVEGVCNVNHPRLENPHVRADFLLYPREHLLEKGFANTWFAVEIKKAGTHWSVAMGQAFWYTLSTFLVKGKQINPPFAMAWVPQRSDYMMSHWESGEVHGFGALNVGWMLLPWTGERTPFNWRLTFYRDKNYATHYKSGQINVSGNKYGFFLGPGNGQRILAHTGVCGEGVAS